MKIDFSPGALRARCLGLALTGLGVWLVVLAATATTDASQAAGSLLGAWSASGGIGLFVGAVPPSTRPSRRSAESPRLGRVAVRQSRLMLLPTGWLSAARVRRSLLAPESRPIR